MIDRRFMLQPAAMPLARVADLVGARLLRGDPDSMIRGAGALDAAGEGDLTFIDNPKCVRHLSDTRASACLASPRFADRVPTHVALLESTDPYGAYALYVAAAYPQALHPEGAYGVAGAEISGIVHPDAQLEENVRVEPGAVVGPGVEIGRNSVVCAGAVIASNSTIGRDSFIGCNATIQYALIGNRVILHPGVRIGQDGFGFALGSLGHRKVGQIGRVIIQDDVEIGANTTIDRGGGGDTVVGEGTKIDNLVQIGHNAEIGRHCLIAAQVGIAASARIGDFVLIGGQAGVAHHAVVGEGARIGAQSGVHGHVPAGKRYQGQPALPLMDWIGQVAALRRVAKQHRAG